MRLVPFLINTVSFGGGEWKPRLSGVATLVLLTTPLLFLNPGASSAASPYRGLWVGTATLLAVNEVTVAFDAENVAVAPVPEVPTPTFDQAHLRLLVHVNGAGQARLLRDVAVVNRGDPEDPAAKADVFARETDLALVTDPRLYPEYPPQPALRLASATFDFGDAKATEALDVLVESAAEGAAAFALDPDLAVETQAERIDARDAAIAALTPDLTAMAVAADVAASFAAFLSDFDVPALETIALASDPAAAAQAFLVQAEALRDQSFYQDARGVDLVQAVVGAADGIDPSDPEGRKAEVFNQAAAFADVDNRYQRLISGKLFGDMILAAADEAAAVAGTIGATLQTIEDALRAIPESASVLVEAIQARAAPYQDVDRRATDAADAVLDAMAEAAFLNATLTGVEIRQLSEAAGREALSERVARYPLPVLTPTLDYDAFVQSVAFAAAVDEAVFAAAAAAVDERAVNVLYTEMSLYGAAKVAAADALRSVYGTAARARRTELPLTGIFAPGSGDPRPVIELAHHADLGPAGLEGELYLPANHPTNPFRHRRHPDHTTGFNIRRRIRLDFDGATGDSLESAGYGVDRISGTYREEIFGLHKPLGSDPDQPVGLKTEGRFELNRISFIDTLNTR